MAFIDHANGSPESTHPSVLCIAGMADRPPLQQATIEEAYCRLPLHKLIAMPPYGKEHHIIV